MGKTFVDLPPQAFGERIQELTRQENFGQALREVSGYVDSVISDQGSGGLVFGSPLLDRLCLDIGANVLARLPAPAPDETDRETIVFLVTELGVTGGHSRVLLDLLEAEGAARAVVLASNLFGSFAVESDPWFPGRQARLDATRNVSEWLGRHGAGLEVSPHHEGAPPGGAPDYHHILCWLMTRLGSLRPRRVYTLIHPFDSTLIAACQPTLVGDLRYYHNYAHALALGVHIPHALHVDFLPKTFRNCRHGEGLEHNVYWPLTAADPGDHSGRAFFANGTMTTCSSGGFEKFVFDHFARPIRFRHRYQELLPLILSATGGRHVHIGSLPPHFLADLRIGLEHAGISPERFIHVDRVDNLARAMVDLGIDLYITSFPLGGGRAAVEAMSIGLGVLAYRNYRSIQFSDADDLYEGVLSWRTPSELEAVLRSVDRETVMRHAASARRRFEQHNRPEHLRDAMRAADEGRESMVPPRPVHEGSALQAYLDERDTSSVPPTERATDLGDRRLHVRIRRKARRVLGHSPGFAVLRRWLARRPRADAPIAVGAASEKTTHGQLSAPISVAVDLPEQADRFADACVAEARAGKVSWALDRIAALVERIIADEVTTGRVLWSGELDQACLDIGAMLAAGRRPSAAHRAADSSPIIALATHIGGVGGHTRALLAHLDAHPDRPRHIVLTRALARPLDRVLDAELKARGIAVEAPPPGSSASRASWLIERLAAVPRAELATFLHPSDSAGVAALQPDLVARIDFVHVYDLGLSLGCRMPHARHVDLRRSIVEICRFEAGSSDIAVWPLAMADRPDTVRRGFLADGKLRTASCGRSEKVTRDRYLRRFEDDYSMVAALPEMLATTGGRHFHYGAMADDVQSELWARLERLGVDADRLVFKGETDSLWRSLVDDQIDVCVMTFPYGGGYVAVEAMGAGVPIIAYAPYRLGYLGYANEIYAEAPRWREPTELHLALKALADPDALATQSAAARACFLAQHSIEALRAAHAAHLDLSDRPLPFRPDRLRWYADVRRAETTLTDAHCRALLASVMASEER
jgi:glycosyltransferase involved in cell wall biosynthesis